MRLRALLFVLSLLFATMLWRSTANAAPISYHFIGNGAGPQPGGGFNAADPSDTIEGIFTFDDSLFSGVGAFRLPPPNDTADRIEQESPDAFIAAERNGIANISTESLIRTTARPDLRYSDWDNASFGVTFGYDNLEGPLGGFINLSFPGIAVLDDPSDLVGATGESLYRTQFQIGGNVFYLFNVEVDALVSGGVVPEPTTLATLTIGLAALWFARRRKTNL